MQRCLSSTARQVAASSKPRPRDSYGYVSLLRSHADDPRRLSHSRALDSGLDRDRFVAAGLVARYAALGRAGVESARHVSHRDAFLWNVMLRGFARAGGSTNDALALFALMRASRAPAGNHHTYTFLVTACAGGAGDEAERAGRAVHALVVRAGVEADVFVGNALVAFYAKCGDVTTARKVFDEVAEKDVVTWNSMIAGYAQNGHSDEAVALLRSMLRRGAATRPDHVTFIAVLPACAALAAVREGLWVHSYVVKSVIGMDAALATGLIAMYAACGRLDTARALFDRVPDKSQGVYGSMIQAYGSHGHGVEALNVFHLMLRSGIAPDGLCFVSVLSACARSGLVEDGLRVFEMMDAHDVEKRQVHYACVVDLLGRAGQLSRALRVVEAMPFERGKDAWGALLGACRLHDHMELAELAADQLLDIDKGNAGRYAALAQMYDDAGRWDDASMVRRLMRDRGVNKPLGSSIVGTWTQ